MALPNIVIIGGGVAGLTAAHEFKERGFSVTVYERKPNPHSGGPAALGGKARSFPAHPAHAYGWAEPGGKSALEKAPRVVLQPAEHGFRFFPGFYQHVIDTLRRIPAEPGRYVIDNLIDIEQGAYAQIGKPFFRFGTRRPDSPRQLLKALERLFLDNPDLGLTPIEAAFAAAKLVNGMTMCKERREAELENVSWWDYMRADDMSEAYRTVVVNGLSQNFVAMDARLSSSRTAITIIARLLNDLTTPGRSVDRILNGPTSEVWIEHWHGSLATAKPGQPAVTFVNAEIESLDFDPVASRITGIKPKGAATITDADAYYILAVPVEAATKILDNTAAATPEIFEHSPSLKSIKDLKVNWMTGIVYYLQADVEMCPGHIVYLNSPWAITSISQNQFWQTKLPDVSPGRASRAGVAPGADLGGLISVIVSDWDTPGTREFPRAAREADSPEEIAREALAQIKAHMTGLGKKDRPKNDRPKYMGAQERTLSDENVVGYCLDTAIVFKPALLGLMTARGFANLLQNWVTSPEVLQLGRQLQVLLSPPEAMLADWKDLKELKDEDGWAKLYARMLGRDVLAGPLGKPVMSWLLSSASGQELMKQLEPIEADRRAASFANFVMLNLLHFLVTQNQEPLFINTIGSWSARPTAVTGIENLFLASDYVKTNTDLATMEGANEGARRAVNGILDAVDSKRPRCAIFEFDESAALAPFRIVDKELFELGLPHPSFLVDPFLSFGAKFGKQARKWAGL